MLKVPFFLLLVPTCVCSGLAPEGVRTNSQTGFRLNAEAEKQYRQEASPKIEYRRLLQEPLSSLVAETVAGTSLLSPSRDSLLMGEEQTL
jgi:hypothetical protein